MIDLWIKTSRYQNITCSIYLVLRFSDLETDETFSGIGSQSWDINLQKEIITADI